ncbi:MAG TPA: hypothetical protein DCS97_04015 [Planctomycetes bacterium]|nr:hypothetical protein [Planctomycetota bacterium]
MVASPSQRWSSAVHDLFACARGRLPASFLERKLAEIGLSAVKPLPHADLQRFEKSVDLVNALVAGRGAPGGAKPDVALAAAFPDDHATLGGLRVLAQEYITSMRPAKAAKPKPAAEGVPVAAPAIAPPREQHDQRGPREPREQRERRDPRPVIAPPAPRPPRITWAAWSARHLGGEAPAAPADGPAPFLPASLTGWPADADAKRQLARIAERLAGVLTTKNAGNDPAAAVRELAFAILRPPLAVRDDLRHLLAEHLQQQGVQITVSALYPPPPVAALKRDWEGLLAARGPEDPAVAAAWQRLLDAHPEARAKLESERSAELEDLLKRMGNAARAEGEDSEPARGLRSRIESRFSGVAERIAAELTQVRAAAEAAAATGRLVAERSWSDPEVAAAIAALEPASRERLLAQRRHELDELDRRFRAALKEHGPEAEATLTALGHLRARFPDEGTNAAERLTRIRRGEDLAQQERTRREAGRSLSSVHLGSAEHRPTRLNAAPSWRLVVVIAGQRGGRGGEGKGRRHGHAVGLLLDRALPHGPVAATWRAPECADLDELDHAVQAIADLPCGVIGLPLADCPERGGDTWLDAVAALTLLARCAIGDATLSVELPAWAETTDQAALEAVASALGATRVACPDHATALAEAIAWSWSGRREADEARIRQSGLAGTCLLEPSPALRENLAAALAGTVPSWPAWGALIDESAGDTGGLAEALLKRVGLRIAGDHEAVGALHRHLVGLARGRIADPARLDRELATFDALAGTQLRARDRLRLSAAQVAAQAAHGVISPAAADRLNAQLVELREEWPTEILETALHAAAHARDALDGERAESFLAPWARAEAIACGGRTMLVRLHEERSRIAAQAGRWKEARKQLDKADETTAKLADPADRGPAQSRLAQLRSAVLADDPAASAEEARNALITAVAASEPVSVAGELAEHGQGGRRYAHHSLLRWAVRRQDDILTGAYLARRESWCDVREAPGGQILALRAIVVAPTDSPAALALLGEAEARLGQSAPTASRLSWAACAVATALCGAVLPDLRERLIALRRERPAATPAVDALERALALAPDTKAGLAEALPLLAR